MKLNRRQLLVGGATLATLAGAPVSAGLSGNRLHLLDPGLGKADYARATTLVAGSVRKMETDLVRHWRDGLAHLVKANGAICYVLWDKALLLTELARENNMPVSSTRLGRSMFAVTVG